MPHAEYDNCQNGAYFCMKLQTANSFKNSMPYTVIVCWKTIPNIVQVFTRRSQTSDTQNPSRTVWHPSAPNIHFHPFYFLLKWWNLEHLRSIFQTALQALAVRPGFLLSGADSDFGSMEKTDQRGQTNLILWLSASHPQTQARAHVQKHARTPSGGYRLHLSDAAKKMIA